MHITGERKLVHENVKSCGKRRVEMNRKFGDPEKNNSSASGGHRASTHCPPTHTHAVSCG